MEVKAREYEQDVILKSPKIKIKEEKNSKIEISLHIDEINKYFVEQVYNNHSKFCIYDMKNGSISYADDYNIYKPIEAEEITKKAILLPTKAEEYGSDKELDSQIKNFIIKWLDVDEDYVQFALWNIKRSWVYERFHTLNYLRALGDTGMGKTRFLDTLGYLHYKPIATSGATTSAPIFRIIDKWKGTLIIDEADYAKSDEAQDIIKIINQGYEKGKFILRCDKENNNQINLFDPYCPKILATRRTFTDKATESRCITQVMKGTTRKNILWNLNDNFWNEVQEIRNKLLMWRFRNYFKIDPNKNVELDIGELEPRVNQIVTSFVNMFGDDKEQMDKFKEFIKNYQEDLIDERQNSFAGQVIGAIHSLLSKGVTNISLQDIIKEENLTDYKGNELKPRALSSTLKSLGFEKSKVKRFDENTKRCVPLNEELCIKLFKRFGYDVTIVTMIKDTNKIIKKDNLTFFTNEVVK